MAMRKLMVILYLFFTLGILPCLILTACKQVQGNSYELITAGPTTAFTIIISTPTPLSFPPAIVSPLYMDTSTPIEKPSATITEIQTYTPPSFTYVFPVQPPAVASFSEGVASHGYPATDIFAPEGTQFVAVTDGVVNYVSYQDTWDPQIDDPSTRGGLSIAIIGNDGVRYYGSHLSKIEADIRPGIKVVSGQLLGLIGHTGDARNKDSHLHFGISHPSYPEDWKARRGQVDPYPYLFAWRSGLNITPELAAP